MCAMCKETVEAAERLGLLEEEAAIEWLRLVHSGTNGFEASKMVDAEFARKLRMAEAEYKVLIHSHGGHDACKSR